jgi:cytochrome P450
MAFLTRCAREYGDFVPLRFGPKRMVFLSHPDLIEYVLVTNNRNFVKSPQFRALGAVGGNGIFLSEGDFWLRQRRLMQPAFHRRRIEGYAEIMVAYATSMVESWSAGARIDVQEEMMHLGMRIAGKALLNADVENDASALGQTLTSTFECLNARVNSIWLLLPVSIPIPTNRRLRASVRRLDDIIYRIIRERRASDHEGPDLLSMLLRVQDEDDGSRMTDQQVRDEVVTAFTAGYETTATTLTWAFYLLSQHPDAEARLFAELSRELGDQPPTAADLPKLPFTEAVISETLRLYPPVPGLGREALADCEIGGHPVRRGTSLLLSMWTLHRDPRYFSEPDDFVPERWGEDLVRRIPRFAYSPFGGGPRQCIGAGFAMMEAMIVLATVAQRYRLSLAPGQVVEAWVAPTVRPKYGMNMMLERR